MLIHSLRAHCRVLISFEVALCCSFSYSVSLPLSPSLFPPPFISYPLSLPLSLSSPYLHLSRALSPPLNSVSSSCFLPPPSPSLSLPLCPPSLSISFPISLSHSLCHLTSLYLLLGPSLTCKKIRRMTYEACRRAVCHCCPWINGRLRW